MSGRWNCLAQVSSRDTEGGGLCLASNIAQASECEACGAPRQDGWVCGITVCQHLNAPNAHRCAMCEAPRWDDLEKMTAALNRNAAELSTAIRIAVGPETPVERVNHPKHYNDHPSGVECIVIVEEFNFNVGNAMKYLWRAGLKGERLEDLRKALWYVGREIERLEKGAGRV